MINHTFHGAVLEITLNHPPVNAVQDEWISQFNAVLDDLAARPEISVVTISSGLRVFSAGADLKLMRESFAGEQGQAALIETTRRMQRLYDRIEMLGQVTVAVVAGAALGGGLELALACDLRIAASDARFGLPEARLGLIPGAGGTQRLSRLCGPGVARRLILAGDMISGAEAGVLGLVQWAVARDELDDEVQRIVGQVSALAPHALVACKQCLSIADGSMQHGMAMELHETLALLNHPETRARVSEFLKTKGS